MNIPQPLNAAFSNLLPHLKIVEEKVRQTLQAYSNERMYPFISRIKTIESAAEKIETGRYPSFGHIDDLVAATMIVPTLQEEEDAISYCKSTFDIFNEKRRASSHKAPDVFRFDTTRLYGRITKPDGLGASTDRSIYDVIFEIQIRTAFEHAWIVATHPLTYKTDDVDWKRFRLAAQLKASVEHLDSAIQSFDTLAAKVTEAPWPALEYRKSAIQMMQTLIQDDVVPTETIPKDMSRFADNLATLIRASKIKTSFQDALNLLDIEFRKLTKETFPRSASILQICIGILSEKGMIDGPLQSYSCHVTEQLIQLYPKAKSLTPVFIYA